MPSNLADREAETLGARRGQSVSAKRDLNKALGSGARPSPLSVPTLSPPAHVGRPARAAFCIPDASEKRDGFISQKHSSVQTLLGSLSSTTTPLPVDLF